MFYLRHCLVVNEYTPSAQFLQRAFGLGAVFMLAPTSLALVDAARRGRLGGDTFRKLNLSIAVWVRGFHSSTSQLNLSRFVTETTAKSVYIRPEE
jgi:hypothetical protein